jgi:hypothetical protein
VSGVDYACDFCGYDGYDPDALLLEQVQCQMCGEPVIDGRGDR